MAPDCSSDTLEVEESLTAATWCYQTQDTKIVKFNTKQNQSPSYPQMYELTLTDLSGYIRDDNGFKTDLGECAWRIKEQEGEQGSWQLLWVGNANWSSLSDSFSCHTYNLPLLALESREQLLWFTGRKKVAPNWGAWSSPLKRNKHTKEVTIEQGQRKKKTSLGPSQTSEVAAPQL